MKTKQQHWEKVYATKKPEELSWTEDVPETSLEFIKSFHLSKTAKIIDIGGGDGKLVDHLLAAGYKNITVLDISATALEKVKLRLGTKAKKVNWIVSDITKFQPTEKYALWHDRATFHFLTTPTQIKKYLDKAMEFINGYLTIGTFAESGPDKCSGLPVKQYSETSLEKQWHTGFHKIRCVNERHITPFNTIQDFLFCSFKSAQ